MTQQSETRRRLELYDRCKKYCYCPPASPSGYHPKCGNCVDADKIALELFPLVKEQLRELERVAREYMEFVDVCTKPRNPMNKQELDIHKEALRLKLEELGAKGEGE